MRPIAASLLDSAIFSACGDPGCASVRSDISGAAKTVKNKKGPSDERSALFGLRG